MKVLAYGFVRSRIRRCGWGESRDFRVSKERMVGVCDRSRSRREVGRLVDVFDGQSGL